MNDDEHIISEIEIRRKESHLVINFCIVCSLGVIGIIYDLISKPNPDLILQIFVFVTGLFFLVTVPADKEFIKKITTKVKNVLKLIISIKKDEKNQPLNTNTNFANKNDEEKVMVYLNKKNWEEYFSRKNVLKKQENESQNDIPELLSETGNLSDAEKLYVRYTRWIRRIYQDIDDAIIAQNKKRINKKEKEFTKEEEEQIKECVKKLGNKTKLEDIEKACQKITSGKLENFYGFFGYEANQLSNAIKKYQHNEVTSEFHNKEGEK